MKAMSDSDFGPMAHTVVPIRIRPELTVFIQGMPHDMSEAEAGKIAAVIQAMAQKDEGHE